MRASLPKAYLTWDRYHLASHAARAVDQVRRAKAKTHPKLKGTRYAWLKRPEHLTKRQAATLQGFTPASVGLGTARAYRWRLGFDAFFDQPVELAEGYLEDWYAGAVRSRLQPIIDFARMLGEHWEGCGAGTGPRSLHAGIGYVTPNDEHQGRGPAIRKARQAGLEQARRRGSPTIAPTRPPTRPSTPSMTCPRSPAMLANRSGIRIANPETRHLSHRGAWRGGRKPACARSPFRVLRPEEAVEPSCPASNQGAAHTTPIAC